MADQITSELIVTAIAKGFDQLEKGITDQAKAFKEADVAARAAAEAAKKQQAAIAEQAKKAREAEQNMKAWGDAGKMALKFIGEGLDYAAAAATRLGRSELPNALDSAENAAQRLGDSLLEMPIGKYNLLFQAFGDETLKGADVITILTRGLQGATDGMNALSAITIQMRANMGQITWEEAAKEVEALGGAVEDAAVHVSAYGERWTALAKRIKSGTADANIKKWLEMREAEEGAARLAALEDAAVLLAAGMSGAVTDAQNSYNDVMADSTKTIEDLQKELDKYQSANGKVVTVTEDATTTSLEYEIALRDLGVAQKKLADNTDPDKALDLSYALERAQEKAEGAAKGLGSTSEVTLDYTTKIDELNKKIAEQTTRQNEAAAALELANKQFVFQQAAVNLDAAGQLELAKKLGLIDEASYNAAKRIMDLTKEYDKNHDGVVDVSEGQDYYIQALDKVSKNADGAATATETYRKQLAQIPDKVETAVVTNYSSTGTPSPNVQTTPLPQTPVAQAAGGGGIVPPGYPADSFMIRAQTGEKWNVQTPGQQLAEAARGGGGATYSFGAVNIYAQPGQDGAALFQEFSAATAAQVRARRAAGG